MTVRVLRHVAVAAALVVWSTPLLAQEPPPASQWRPTPLEQQDPAAQPPPPQPPPPQQPPIYTAPPQQLPSQPQYPYPYPPPQPIYTPPPPRDPADIKVHSIKMEAGGAFRKLDQFEVLGMDLRGAFGSENGSIGHYGTIGLVWGATEQHLRTYMVTLGYNLDARIDIVRLGFGVEAGYLFVRRASFDSRMYSLGFGAWGHVSVDVVNLGRDGHDALYLDLRVEGSLHYEDIAFWGPSLLAGFRF